MPSRKKTARKRIVQAALELFALQGVTETTTRQIADRADVNEVTLFRNFGSKHGLLLAVIQEAEELTQWGDVLGQLAANISEFDQTLEAYAEGYLEALDRIREFVRSLIGEAGHYPPENREAIGRGLNEVKRYTEQYLVMGLSRSGNVSPLPPDALASLLNTLLLGYAIIEFTTEIQEFQEFWPSREAFIQDVVRLLGTKHSMEGGAQDGNLAAPTASGPIEDIPAPLVRVILQTARKLGPQDYALAYVLFGAGLSPCEAAGLKRNHSLSDSQQHVLLVMQREGRQVPVNKWIMGYRYGSYEKNPLSQWIRSRKDDQDAIFVTEQGQPMCEMDVRLRWQAIVADLTMINGRLLAIEQAQQTWCVEMLMRGMSPENLSLLTGWAQERLKPYVNQAQARLALEQAIQLDERSGKREGG